MRHLVWPWLKQCIPGSGVNWVNLNGTTGIEVENKDTVAYAKAIDMLLADEKLAKEKGEAGHRRVMENFTIPKMVEAMEQCYQEIG